MVQTSDNWAAGPLSQPYLKRSKYLAEALQSMSAPQENIRSPWELAAKLGAVALTGYADKKNDAKLKDARKQDLDNETATMVKLLGGAFDSPSSSAPSMSADPAVEETGYSAPKSSPILQNSLPDIKAPSIAPREKDLLTRILIGEAGSQSDQGQQAVAAVIANRAKQSGMSIGEVISAPGQFEPFGNRKRWTELQAIPPDSPQYQRAATNAELALSGQAQLPPEVAGADHFYSPKTQTSLGRQAPSWDNGKGADLEDHRFFALGYGGQPPVQPQQRPPMGAIDPSVAMTGGINPGAPQPQMQLPTGQAPPQLSMPELAQPQGGVQPYQVASNGPTPPPPQGQQGQNPRGPTQQEMAMYQAWMGSGDPSKVQAARELAQKIQARMAAPVEYDTTVTRGGQIVQTPKIPGQGKPMVSDIPGFRQQLSGNLEYGADGRAHAIKGAEDRIVSAEQLGINAPAGTMFVQSPTGDVKPLYAPPQGYQTGNSAVTMSPVRGGPQDPQAAGGEVQRKAVLDYHGQFKPIVDAATKLNRSYQSMNVGFGQQDGAGDIAMINGIQRMIDEGVVREGDVSLQLKGQGLEGGLSGLKGYITSQGFFTPDIRNRLKATADGLYGQIMPSYRDQVMSYAPGIDQTYGQGTFEKIVPSQIAKTLGWINDPASGSMGNGQSGGSGRSGPAGGLGGLGGSGMAPQAKPPKADFLAEYRRRGIKPPDQR